MTALPQFLTHYYKRTVGPFRHLTEHSTEEAELLLQRLRDSGTGFAAKRSPNYLAIRLGLEARMREQFQSKGGLPSRSAPYYLVLGDCDWLLDWYPNAAKLVVPLAAIPPMQISFTYGDSFPAMRVQDGKPYRGQVYTLAELPGVLSAYGLPQEWNGRRAACSRTVYRGAALGRRSTPGVHCPSFHTARSSHRAVFGVT
ncbi:hypothetical protein J31TS4_02070 [Paenibacillus sp. J31TS4]|uniref:hypothetical protein n=1 Tax=Paenibacillus sp. J31TS4 TaxID=2807195 RepID=UPI001B2937A3|nr:hypothetical protein [Paenibacillus sp. J31TS4]GIP36927.1 hypothetical protein J31TS4_02070 [Paenibacillus sp. J31TS4]